MIRTPVTSSAPQHITLTGHRPQEVLEVIRERIRTNRRDDGHRLAVVVEGGAMRGVYTAGALLALHFMGATALFDDAYGTSAGAVNVAHFLSGNGEATADTYYRALADGRFFNRYRLRKIVDVDFMVDQVLTRLRPMEVPAVLQSPTRLWIAVADYLTAQRRLFHAQTCGFPLLELIRAATAMPVLYNRLVPLGDVLGFDAGAFSPFPLQEAIGHGATHLLLLLAKPADHVTQAQTWWVRNLIRYRFARTSPAVRELFSQSAAACNELRDLAHGRTPLPSARTALATVAPAESRVGRASQNVDLLRHATVQTARATLRLFGHDERQLDLWSERTES